ncbi:hypothetical protein BH10BAC2_BH10BAC2_15480 [soil metagenome]
MRTIKLFLTILLIIAGYASIAQAEIPPAPSDKALVVFIRPPELQAALDNWVLMANGDEFCRISNNRYVTYLAAPGNISFTSKRGGIGIGKPKDVLELELEAGKTYYVQCDVKLNLVSIRILLNEITLSTAKKFLLKAQPDNCELKKKED